MEYPLYDLYKNHPDICIDTRTISKDCLFFALKGPNFNANEFALDALEKGAAFAIVDEEKYVLDERFILVDDALQALQNLANHHRRQLKCPIIAITGSNGKTTSKELCNRVLQKKHKTKATQGNLNNHIGVPLSLLAIGEDIEIAIIEMGANHIGEIEFLCTIAEPNYGAITNIGKAHLEGFGSLEGVVQAKTELYNYLSRNNSEIFVKDNNQLLLDHAPKNCNLISYGQLGTSTYPIIFKGAQPYAEVSFKKQQIKSCLIGDYNFDNIALSIAVGMKFGVPVEQIKSAIETYIPTNNRSQLIETKSNTLLLDAYNANPTSVEKAIDNMTQMAHSNKIMILGDMFELGSSAKQEHINIINSCIKSGIKDVRFVGEIFNSVNTTSYRSYKTTADLMNELKSSSINNSFILIKGSRGMKLEQLVEHL